MRINRITFYNYRLYKGLNTIQFKETEGKNIYLVCGENGFGKTTFLHSLLWCLYGKMMTEVDDSIRKEILAKGGYIPHLETNLNMQARRDVSVFNTQDPSKKKKIPDSGDNQLDNATYYVSIDFSDVYVPSVPCKSIKITRSYNCVQKKESVSILIDGSENELTEEIGNDIFINDFILNRDVARFFFFDSERIVNLAEINNADDRKKLNSAYNQVLGVKKYEDLKNNIDNLRLKFRRRSNDIISKEKLEKYFMQKQAVEDTITSIDEQLNTAEDKLIKLKQESERFQDQLLREGDAASSEKMRQQQRVIEKSKELDEEYKQKLKAFFDLAPFAIAGRLMSDTYKQVEQDYKISQNAQQVSNQNDLVDNIAFELNNFLATTKISKLDQKQVSEILASFKRSGTVVNQLIDVSKEEHEEVSDVFHAINSTYRVEFERLIDDYKKNRQRLDRATKSVTLFHAKGSDTVVQDLRRKKQDVDDAIGLQDREIGRLHEQKSENTKELTVILRNISELSKIVSLDGSDSKKDELAGQLSSELNDFLINLKQEKKYSLERRIKVAMNGLMHKEDFIGNVEVVVTNGEMDIVLYQPNGTLIRKDSLSKGEQQLYATSLLKALVEESGIEFPVFIDSPLQKFDKSHSSKIIQEFYPSISKQVVLFPLLHKELTEQELELMKPRVNSAFKIRNHGTYSVFEKVAINKLMEA